MLQGEFFISGFTNKQLRTYLFDKSASQVTRLLKRLRVHSVIKKVGKRYKYYLTDFGRETAALALKLREMVVIPTLAYPANRRLCDYGFNDPRVEAVVFCQKKWDDRCEKIHTEKCCDNAWSRHSDYDDKQEQKRYQNQSRKSPVWISSHRPDVFRE